MKKLNRLIDLLIDRIVMFSDYFIIKKHITLSEAAIFAFSFSRAVWFGIFGVRDVSYDMLWGDYTWFGIYSALTISHFVTFFIENKLPRAVVLFLNAFLWSFLGILAYLSGNQSPAITGLGILSLLCIFIGVRLYLDKHRNS